jgi:sugar phosphate isomerase/epimerase
MTITRRDLGRLVAGESLDQTPTRVDPAIGLTVPESFGRPDLSTHEITARCAAVGATVLELDIAPVEALLGLPPEPAWLRLPEVTFETGLIPGEEEIYAEPIEIGRRTLEGQRRAWRRSVSLAPLDALRRELDVAGIRVAIVAWGDLASRADEEIAYACRLTRAVGAQVLSTELTPDGPRRLAPLGRAHQVRISFRGGSTSAPTDLDSVLRATPSAAVSVNVGAWAGRGSPVPWLVAHADRVTHAHLADVRASDGAPALFGRGDAPIQDVLEALRNRQWSGPALVAIAYDLDTEADQAADVARALAYCRDVLRSPKP